MLAATLGITACVFGQPEAASKAEKRPNVLLIVLDTTRPDFLSCYGYKKRTTGGIDRLARKATRYTKAFATDFWTLPSHASLLTGLYPSEAQATSETNHLPDRVTTIAETLQAAGYRTGAIVCNPWISGERGFSQGFSYFHEVRPPEVIPSDFHVEQAGAYKARDWLTEAAGGDQPFFFFANFNLPHLPYRPQPSILRQFQTQPWPEDHIDRLMKVSGMWSYLGGAIKLDEQDFAAMRDLYASEIHLADRFVHQLVYALDAAKVLGRTLVIVTSDHGENIGDHGMIDHLLSMYDSTIHVPLLIRYPKRFEKRAVKDELVSLVDIVPTILDVCGLANDTNKAHVAKHSLCSPDRERRTFVTAENERPVNGIQIMKKKYPEFDTEPIDRAMRMIR
ncbi:MAG: sulfatase, partial [Phycisphaerae bacterium]